MPEEQGARIELLVWGSRALLDSLGLGPYRCGTEENP